VNGKPIKSSDISFLTHSKTLRDHNSAIVVQMELKLAGRLVYDVILIIMQKKTFFNVVPTCLVFVGPVTYYIEQIGAAGPPEDQISTIFFMFLLPPQQSSIGN